MSAIHARETDPRSDAHPPAAAANCVAGGDQQTPNPQDAPILSYYTPPKRRQFRVTVRHTRALVIAMAGLLLGSLYATGGWLLTIGPKLPTVMAHEPVGISDKAIAIEIADRISAGGQWGETNRRLLEYLRGHGMTMLDGPVPSGRSEQAVLQQFRIDEIRKDAYSSIVWFKLPTGWLAIGPMSIMFWPDEGNWHTETTWWPDGNFESSGISTRTIYQLVNGMQAETFTSGLGATTYLGVAGRKQWQTSTAMRIGLWGSLVLGVLVAIAALRTRTSGEPRWVLRVCLTWSLLAGGLFIYAGWTIVPFGEVFQLASSPAVPQFRLFGLLVPAITGLLLSGALWLHQSRACGTD